MCAPLEAHGTVQQQQRHQHEARHCLCRSRRARAAALTTSQVGFGEQGYVRVQRGVGMCKINSQVNTAIVK